MRNQAPKFPGVVKSKSIGQKNYQIAVGNVRMKDQQDIFLEKDKILDFENFTFTIDSALERFHNIKTDNEVSTYLTLSNGRKITMLSKSKNVDSSFDFLEIPVAVNNGIEVQISSFSLQNSICFTCDHELNIPFPR